MARFISVKGTQIIFKPDFNYFFTVLLFKQLLEIVFDIYFICVT